MDLASGREKLREVGRDLEYLFFIHQVAQQSSAEEIRQLIQQLSGQLPAGLDQGAQQIAQEHVQWMSQQIHQKGLRQLHGLTFTQIMERLEDRAWDQLVLHQAQGEGEAIFVMVKIAIMQFVLWIRENLENQLEEWAEPQDTQSDKAQLEEVTGGKDDMFPGQEPMRA